MPRTAAPTSSSPRNELAAALIVCATLLSATPLVAADREHQQLLADLRMLEEQTQQLRVALSTLSEALTEALKTITGRLDDQNAVNRKALADQRVLIETLGSDVRVIREKLDDNNVRVSSLSQEVEALRTTLSSPPPAPTLQPDDQTGLLPDGTTAPPPPQPVAPSMAGLSPQRMWDSAYGDYSSGQWTLAVLGFEQFIKAFPKSEQADDAQFYVGETLALDGKFDEAVQAYDKVVTNYPTGDAVPGAYYKRGLLLARLGQADRARESWQTVVQKFPGTDMANLAKQALDRQARPAR